MVQGTSDQRNNSYIQSYLNNELSSFFLFYEIVKNLVWSMISVTCSPQVMLKIGVILF